MAYCHPTFKFKVVYKNDLPRDPSPSSSLSSPGRTGDSPFLNKAILPHTIHIFCLDSSIWSRRTKIFWKWLLITAWLMHAWQCHCVQVYIGNYTLSKNGWMWKEPANPVNDILISQTTNRPCWTWGLACQCHDHLAIQPMRGFPLPSPKFFHCYWKTGIDNYLGSCI
jgi:hypothetical protein